MATRIKTFISCAVTALCASASIALLMYISWTSGYMSRSLEKTHQDVLDIIERIEEATDGPSN